MKRTLGGLDAWLLLATLAAFLAPTDPARAHSTARDAIGQYAELEIYADSVRVKYLIDYGAVPAELELDAVDPNRDNRVEPEERAAYLERKTAEILTELKLERNGVALPLQSTEARVAFGDGGHGDSTVRVSWSLLARAAPERERPETNLLVWNDGNYEGTRGWKEIRFTPRDWIRVTKSSVAEPDADLPLGEHRHHHGHSHGVDVIPQDTKAWCQFRVTGSDPGEAGRSSGSPADVPDQPQEETAVSPAPEAGGAASRVAKGPFTLALLGLGALAILGFVWWRR